METIKEEKKADLKQLLNSLIEKGWKRKGKEKIEKATIRLSESWQVYFGTEEHPYLYADTLRGITSKNSGLWQFVCENGMVAEKSEGILYRYDDYKYRLTNCALKDESELEEFLLSNIKVEG